jgi:ABC-type sulfate transport system permease component
MSSRSAKMKIETQNIGVIVALLFVVVSLPITYKFVGNSLAMIGLPTEVKEIVDKDGNTCQQVPNLLIVIHAVVIALLTCVVYKWCKNM